MSTPIPGMVDLTPLVAPVASYKLFNPNPEEVVRDFGARTFRFPAVHEDRGAGKGVLPIGDIPIRGHEDSKGKSRVEMLPALAIVQYFCGMDGRSGVLSDIGIRPLPSDPLLALEVRREAEAACVEAKYRRALQIKLTHMSRVQKEKEAGVALTPPDKLVREAMLYVIQVERERGLSGAVSCTECAWQLATEADLTAHVAEQHPEKAKPGQSFNEPPRELGVLTAEIKAQAVAESTRPGVKPIK